MGRGPDSLIVVSDSRPGEYELTRHFWGIGNYSKFIRGYTRVEVREEGVPDGILASAYIAPTTAGWSSSSSMKPPPARM